MIDHVWSILCDKVVIDQETNNLSLDVIDQINIPAAEFPEGGRRLVPIRLSVVSFWYRRQLDHPARVNTRIRYVDPDQKEIGTIKLDVDLTNAHRARSIARMGGVPITRAGFYRFIVEVESETKEWKEVASVPLEVQSISERQAEAPRAGNGA